MTFNISLYHMQYRKLGLSVSRESDDEPGFFIKHGEVGEFIEKILKAQRAAENYYKSGYVYIMYDPSKKAHKIGYSIAPEARCKAVNRKAIIVHTITSKCMSHDESILHRYFWPKHIKGEYFDLSENDIDFIKSLERISDESLQLA